MSLTFGSLFAGIGGFDLGFERAGMVCKWQVEIDEYATKVLKKHWPHVHRERDIRQCGKHNLEAVDVICGGFPCQDISYAGLGAGLEGERSGLFFEAIRVVRELQPEYVVLENVAALLTRGLDRVLGTLAEIGYDAEWHCIPAAAVGAPHIRDRVFLLGWNTNRSNDNQISQGNKQNAITSRTGGRSHETKSPILADTGRKLWETGRNNKAREKAERKPSAGVIKRCGEAGANGHDRGMDKRKKQDAMRSEWWAVEPAVGRVANGVSDRVDRLRGLGNAVVPQVAEWIGRQIVEQDRMEG